ncbi:maltoporin [Klebsiella pneumoniae]|nr:maltoporin [Klebsiella pneumoniae]
MNTVKKLPLAMAVVAALCPISVMAQEFTQEQIDAIVLPGTSPFPLSSDGCSLLSISTAHYSRSAADSQQHGYGLHIHRASNPRLFGAG